MYKVLIWGIGSYYDKHISNQLEKEIQQGTIDVIAYISKNTYGFSYFNNKPIIPSSEIIEFDFDYIIVASSFYIDICQEAQNKYNIPLDKIINGIVFKYPCFDFGRYIKIKSQNLSLISESCYGGYIYNKLNLQFTSPLINTRITSHDYIKLVKNLEYYFSQALQLEQSFSKNINELAIDGCSPYITWGKMGYPIFRLDDVLIHAVHAKNPNDFLMSWNRRMNRFNRDSIFVFMIIENDKLAEQFAELPIKNKVGFYYKDTPYKSIINLKEYEDINVQFNSDYYFRNYVHSMIYNENKLKTVDIFKLLLGESDFYRFK